MSPGLRLRHGNTTRRENKGVRVFVEFAVP